MKMTRIAASLLCSVAPIAALAQEVALESPDQFISVEGEIVDYDGFMVRVATAVGDISLPASEVVCFGEGCFEIIANNDFGLTADAFISVIASSDVVEETPQQTDFSVAFATDGLRDAFGALVNGFATSGGGTSVEISADGVIGLTDPETGSTATVTRSDDAANADMSVSVVSLEGSAPQAYATSSDWVDATAMSHHLLGVRAFAVIAAPTAGIDSISLEDLARVYAGEVTNWSQIGGADINVLPLQLPTTSALRAEMESLVMAPVGKSIAGNVLTMADEAGITASINQFPGSISIVSAENANAAPTVSVAGTCGTSVSPTAFNIASGDYPLIRPVMAASDTGAQNALVTDLFGYATTAAGQALMDGAGLSSVAALQQDSAVKNTRLGGLLDADLDEAQRNAAAQMFQVLFNADRLSPTLIGGATSGPEAAWNAAMMQSIVAIVSDPANAGREIIFAGKAENAAGSEAALAASVAAAQAMQAALGTIAAEQVAASSITVTSYGFGDVSPATCVDGQVAGTDYTRVEVWIR